MRSLVVVVVVLASACSKSEPVQGARAAKSLPATLGWVELDTKLPLAKQIEEQAAAAVAGGKKPHVYLHADWCGPCVAIKQTRDDPRMVKAFEVAHIIGIDLDAADPKELAAAKLDGSAIPVFYRVDAKGLVTGDKIDGGAWGDNIPENMAPPLTAFFAK